MKAVGISLWILYIIAAVIDIHAVRSEEEGKHRLVKPMLMPILAAAYLTMSIGVHRAPNGLLVIGILLGCAGDVLLLDNRFFMYGLLAFLGGHVFYIAAFLFQIHREGAAVPGGAYFVFPFYLVYILAAARPILAELESKMKTAGYVYMAVILFMSYVSFLLLCACGPRYALTFFGSLLFVLSDTILSRQVFLNEPDRGVMETYTAAQALIALGFLV